MLVADRVSPTLADALETLREHMAAGHRDGLSGEDFTRLPRAERLAALRRRAGGAGSATASSCRAPTSIRANTCRRAAESARLAHRLYRLGRSRASCCPSARRCSSTGAIPCRRRPQADAALFEIAHLIDEPPSRLARAQRARNGDDARLRPVAAHPAGVERLRAAAEAAPGRRCVPVGDNPLDRVWTGDSRPHRSRRRCRTLSASPARARRTRSQPSAAPWPRKGSTARRADDAGLHRLAAQHPRRRRCPTRRCRCPSPSCAADGERRLVHRPAQARPRPGAPSRQPRSR